MHREMKRKWQQCYWGNWNREQDKAFDDDDDNRRNSNSGNQIT